MTYLGFVESLTWNPNNRPDLRRPLSLHKKRPHPSRQFGRLENFSAHKVYQPLFSGQFIRSLARASVQGSTIIMITQETSRSKRDDEEKHLQSHQISANVDTTAPLGNENVPRQDGGTGAWLFLAGASIIEIVAWGQ